MNTTMKDIAKKTNVSIATVSMVLRDIPCRVSKGTADRIKEVAKELNYLPNIHARSLVTRKTKSIGVLIPDLENTFFSSLAKYIEIELRKYGYVTILVNSDEDLHNDSQLLHLLAERNVDGMILALSNESIQHFDEIKTELDNYRLPFLLVDRIHETIPCNKVYFNNRKGGYLIAKHIIEKGHKKIGVLSTSRFSNVGLSRYNGILDAIQEFKSNNIELYSVECKFSYSDGFKNIDELLNKKVSAIIAMNDMLAYGAMKRIRELNLEIPSNVSITGYDNLFLSQLFDIPLTTINQDVESLSRNAVTNLIDLIENKKNSIDVVLEPQLIIRNSVKSI